MEEITCIYVVYCKDDSGINILNKAYKSKFNAYKYAVDKITTLLNLISEDFKKSENKILPIGAQVIYTLYNMKKGNYYDQYDYFKANYMKFFQHVARKPVMFYVSALELI